MSSVPNVINIPGQGLPTGFDLGSVAGQLNLSDKRDLSGLIIRLDIAFITLVSLVVGLRIFARVHIVGRLFLDDILVIIAAVFTIISAALSIAAAKNAGLGKHVWTIALSDLLNTLPVIKLCVQHLFVIYITYACAIAFTKFSIICSYLRIIPSKGFRYIMLTTGSVVLMFSLSSVFVIIFQCNPMEAAWDFTISDRKCIDFVKLLWVSGVVGLVTDLVMTLVPMPHFWKLQLPTRQKIILCLLFCIGGVASVAGIVRLTTLPQIDGGIDIIFLTASGTNWSVIECSVGIICVSIPTLRPLVNRYAPHILLSRRRSTKGVSTSDDITLSAVQDPRNNSKARINVIETVDVDYEEADGMPTPPRSTAKSYGPRVHDV